MPPPYVIKCTVKGVFIREFLFVICLCLFRSAERLMFFSAAFVVETWTATWL